jgi:uncharacterized protein with PQ loop repeat
MLRRLSILQIQAAVSFTCFDCFPQLSVGAVRAKNVKNILLYILMDATIGAICWCGQSGVHPTVTTLLLCFTKS